MYHKLRTNGSQSILNLDSLMDILSCLVGVMLFLVMYTVLELGSASFEVTVPVPAGQPLESRRVLALANGGHIRLLDAEQPVADLSTGIDQIPLQDLPEFVRQVNLSPPTDAYFRYTLDYDEVEALLSGQDEAFAIRVDEIPGEPGERLRQLDADSRFARLLDDLDPEVVWIQFGVDDASLDVFRRARDLAEQRGFSTRWGPLSMDFPVTFPLTEDAEGPAPRDLSSKPTR